jgi:hypothetical protein
VYAKDVVKVKCWVGNTDDLEQGLVSCEHEALEEVIDLDYRYSIFKKVDSSDKNVSHQIFSFRYNTCQLLEGAKMRENFFFRLLNNTQPATNFTCPIPKGLKFHFYNSTIGDRFLPPISVEMEVRSHKAVYGKVKKTKKWTKLFTQDIFMRIKK